MSFEFIFYDSTVILIIAHFLDSAHDQEWNEPIYFGSYPFWLISTILIITFTIIGIIPVYVQTKWGHWFSILVGIAGLAGAGYHMPMNYLGKSNVCNNNFSYILIYILSSSCILLLYNSIKNLFFKDSKINKENNNNSLINK